MCGWCLAYCTGVVLNTVYGKVPRLILKKKTSRLTQVVVFFRRHFLCGALLCNWIVHRQSVKVYLHICTAGMFSRTLYAQQPVTKNFHISPRFSPSLFYREAFSILLLAHLCTAVLTERGSMRRTLCSQLFIADESVKVYLHTCTTGMFSRTLYA